MHIQDDLKCVVETSRSRRNERLSLASRPDSETWPRGKAPERALKPKTSYLPPHDRQLAPKTQRYHDPARYSYHALERVSPDTSSDLNSSSTLCEPQSRASPRGAPSLLSTRDRASCESKLGTFLDKAGLTKHAKTQGLGSAADMIQKALATAQSFDLPPNLVTEIAKIGLYEIVVFLGS